MVDGLLLLDLSPEEIKIFDYFEEEGVDYIRKQVEVCIQQASMTDLDLTSLEQTSPSFNKEGVYHVKTNAYIWAKGEHYLDLMEEWDCEIFRKNHLKWYMELTVKPCIREFIDEHL